MLRFPPQLGIDPDYARRDLFESIRQGNHPSWKLYIQVVRPDQVHHSFTYNPFDATKVSTHDHSQSTFDQTSSLIN